jgi:hypothetical protein
MKKILLGLAALPFFAGVAMAGQPTSLSDKQMDEVSAGGVLISTLIDYNTQTAVTTFGTQSLFPLQITVSTVNPPPTPTIIISVP